MEELPICGYCGQEVQDKQARIQALCSLETCGESIYHVWCCDAFINMCQKHNLMKTGSLQKQKIASKNKPWKTLELCIKCPAGWYKQEDALRGMTRQQLDAAQRSARPLRIKALCTGRVVSADMMDVAPARPKKGKFRSAQPQPASARPPPAGGSAAAAPGAGNGAPHEPKATMSLAAAKEFLGISSDDDEDDGPSFSNSETAGGGGGGGARPDPLAALSRLSHAATESETDTSAFIDDPGGGGSVEGTGARASPAPSSALSAALATEPPPVLTRVEVEVAVRDGLLPQNYRTRFCPRLFPGGGVDAPGGGVCSLGAACPDAHSLTELRIDAAIAAVTIPADFKAFLCEATAAGGLCPAAAATCRFAHCPQDLRAASAVALSNLDPHYKTQVYSVWIAAGGSCPSGLLCPHAHGAAELRQEAAVELGVHPPEFKTSICPYDAAGFCGNFDTCAAAHGARDLRLPSLRATGEVNSRYKTDICIDWERGNCQAGEWCPRAHGEDELLPEVDPGATLCPLAEELGACPLEEGTCWFAHSVDELQPSEERWEAIHRFAAAFAARQAATAAGSPGPASSAASSTAASMTTSPVTGGRLPFDYEQYKKAAAAKRTVGGGGGGRRGAKGEVDSQTKGSGGSAGGSRRSKGARGERDGPPRPTFSGRRRPNELRLCANIRDMGRCPVVNCEYAHDKEELSRREAAWVQREREQEAARRAAEVEARRAASEAKKERCAAEAAAMESMGFEGAAEAVAESLITSAIGGGGGGATRSAGKDPRIEAAWGQISQAALGLLRTHKIDACALKLMELGFEGEVPAAAATAAGADFDEAVTLALEAAGDVNRLRMRRQKECDVAPELEGLLSFAFERGLTAVDVDVELSIAGGDWERARAALAVRHLAAAQAASGVSAALAESAAEARRLGIAPSSPKRSPRGRRSQEYTKILQHKEGLHGIPPLAPLAPLPGAEVVTAPLPVPAVASVDLTLEDEAASSAPLSPGLPPLPRSLDLSSLAEPPAWGGGADDGTPPPLPSPALTNGSLEVDAGVRSELQGGKIAAVAPAPPPAVAAALPAEEEDLGELLGLLGVGS